MQTQKIKYLCEECYETWTSETNEKTCPYCGSDMITAEKKRS
ncbi:hydrogenase maturation nickel metallochaperone HypA [archaeon]|nr:hydrogenase maturation nickel metallochaperone HypA [archaeon]